MENNHTWTYKYLLYKNKDWIKTLTMIVLITILFIYIPILFVSSSDIPTTIIDNLWLAFLIIDIYALSIFISLILYRKGYYYEYIIKDNSLRVIKDYIPISHEIIVNQRIGSYISFDMVKYLKLNKDKEYIVMRGTLTYTHIYVNKEYIEEVYEILKDKCKNLKGAL